MLMTDGADSDDSTTEHEPTATTEMFSSEGEEEADPDEDAAEDFPNILIIFEMNKTIFRAAARQKHVLCLVNGSRFYHFLREEYDNRRLARKHCMWETPVLATIFATRIPTVNILTDLLTRREFFFEKVR